MTLMQRPTPREKIPAKIRLNHSRYSHAYSREESLWEKEIGRILDLISIHLKGLGDARGNMKNKYDTDLSFLSIGLFGTYGSGKSSLLRTFFKRVEPRSRELEDLGYGHLQGKMFCLELIEPNIQNKDDQFLYAFLAQALESDMNRHREKYERFRDTQVLSEVQQKFQEVSEYLQVLDSRVQKPDFDPLGVSLERLERHNSGLRLIEKMHEFLDVLADSLCGTDRNSVILMPVDDADMSLEGLVSTLDTLRRYLQHPRLVPIFAFTGRLAEELLRVHYEKRLTMDQEKDMDRLREASTQLSITENLAIQYLGKLFPVRNRIKLGPAAARVQAAEYFETNRDEEEGQHAFLLLETASRILFGCPEWSVLPVVRSPLRSSTLRRQLHVLDAMHAARVHGWIPKKDHDWPWDGPTNPDLSWAQMFDRATWALMNVHRDVLKEYQMNLDDLYSWTPSGLRQVVLTSVLNQELRVRRLLIKHWRYRTEDRRSQMLSLLAANAFRPHMYKEEQTGDDPLATKLPEEIVPEKLQDWYSRSFSIRKGSIWFFQLWIGFYLPQILARNRNQKLETPVLGVGWDLRSGPIHAVREALINDNVHPTGMLFLDPSGFSEKVRGLVKDQNEGSQLPAEGSWHNLLLQIWSCYGHHNGGVFAAISLWRGVGLLALLLKADVEYRKGEDLQRYQNAKNTSESEPGDQEKKRVYRELRERRGERLRATIYRHLKNAKVLGSPLTSLDPGPRDPKTEIAVADYESFGQWRFFDIQTPIHHLTERIMDWLDTFPPSLFRIKPMAPTDRGIDIHNPKRGDWKACFVRRIHGENLMSLFWEDLENLDVGELSAEWTSTDALLKWVGVLADYWDCGRGFDPKSHSPSSSQNMTQTLLMNCPFVEPFSMGKKKLDGVIKRWEVCWQQLLDLGARHCPSEASIAAASQKLIEELAKKSEQFDWKTFGKDLAPSNAWDKERKVREFDSSIDDLALLLFSHALQKMAIESGSVQIEDASSVSSLLDRSKVQNWPPTNPDHSPQIAFFDSVTKARKDCKAILKKLADWREEKDLSTRPRRPDSSVQVLARSQMKLIEGKLGTLHARITHYAKKKDHWGDSDARRREEEDFPKSGWAPKFGWDLSDFDSWRTSAWHHLLACRWGLFALERDFESYFRLLETVSVPKAKSQILAFPETEPKDLFPHPASTPRGNPPPQTGGQEAGSKQRPSRRTSKPKRNA